MWGGGEGVRGCVLCFCSVIIPLSLLFVIVAVMTTDNGLLFELSFVI